MRFHILQHISFESAAGILRWIVGQGYEVKKTLLSASSILPQLEEFDALIVMGGPMGAYQETEYPHLVAEKALIRAAIENGKHVLGVCLGAQLMASAMGANVYPGEQKEIGWFPIRLEPAALAHPIFQGMPEEFSVLHWHGDTFDIPSDGCKLARSTLTPNQAFMLGDRALALQFHLEMGLEDARLMVAECSKELVPATFVQSGDQILREADLFKQSEDFLARLLKNFFGV